MLERLWTLLAQLVAPHRPGQASADIHSRLSNVEELVVGVSSDVTNLAARMQEFEDNGAWAVDETWTPNGDESKGADGSR